MTVEIDNGFVEQSGAAEGIPSAGMTALGPLTYVGSRKRPLHCSISCNAIVERNAPETVSSMVLPPAVPSLQSAAEAPAGPGLDESSGKMRPFLHGLGRFIYLILLISLGTVFALIQTLDSTQSLTGHEPNCIFEAVSLSLSVILLGVVIYQLSMESRRKNAESRGSAGNILPSIPHKSSHEELNVILRIGLILFSLGAIILSFLRIITMKMMHHIFTGKQLSIRLTNYVVQIIFYTLQTYVAFKYKASDLQAVSKYAEFIRFVLIHLVAMNLNIWFNTVVLEATEINKMIKFVHDTAHNNTRTMNTTTQSKDNPVQNAQMYFFPFVIEYTIVVSGVLINLYLNFPSDSKDLKVPSENEAAMADDLNNMFLLRQITASKNSRSSVITTSSRSVSVDSFHALGFVPLGPRQNACDKAHTGLFLSLVLCAFYVVYIACHFFFDDHLRLHRLILILTHIGIHTISLLLVIVIVYKILFKFRFVEGKEMFVDNFLMTISFFAIVINSIFAMVPLFRQLFLGIYADFTEIMLFLLLYLLDVLQYFLQTIFLLAGVNLRAANEEQRKWKPGNTILLLLIAMNIMTWFEESLLYKVYNSVPIYIEYYGIDAWSLITSACKPLVVFYRCHSAAMFAEIWSNVYKRDPSHDE